MQMAVDHLAYPMIDQYLEDKREEAKRRGGNQFLRTACPFLYQKERLENGRR